MLQAYPGLFPDESNALHHLFFVNGNGFDWINGELFDKSYYAMRKEVKEMQEEHLKEYGTTDLNFIRKKELEFREQYRKDEEKYQFGKFGNAFQTLYPICDYACIANIPNDIKRDWLKAARKAIQMAETERITTDEDKIWIEKAKVRLLEFPQ